MSLLKNPCFYTIAYCIAYSIRLELLPVSSNMEQSEQVRTIMKQLTEGYFQQRQPQIVANSRQ